MSNGISSSRMSTAPFGHDLDLEPTDMCGEYGCKVRVVATCLTLFWPGMAYAFPTQAEMVEAARCIGVAIGRDAEVPDHIKPGIDMQQRRKAAFEQLLTLPHSPDPAAMRQALTAGQAEGSQPPDPFDDIADVAERDAACFTLIERLGLRPLVYHD